MIGVNTVGIDPDVWNTIWARCGVTRLVADTWPYFSVGARVPKDLAFARRDGAGFNRRFDLGNHFVLGDGQEFFFTGQSITNRLFRDQGECRHQRFQLGVQLGTVTATDIGDADPNVMHRYTKGVGKLGAHIGRRLAGSPDVEALLFV